MREPGGRGHRPHIYQLWGRQTQVSARGGTWPEGLTPPVPPPLPALTCLDPLLCCTSGLLKSRVCPWTDCAAPPLAPTPKPPEAHELQALSQAQAAATGQMLRDTACKVLAVMGPLLSHCCSHHSHDHLSAWTEGAERPVIIQLLIAQSRRLPGTPPRTLRLGGGSGLGILALAILHSEGHPWAAGQDGVGLRPALGFG